MCEIRINNEAVANIEAKTKVVYVISAVFDTEMAYVE